MKSNSMRPRRSALYMPCSNVRALDKAQTLAADVLIFDLEDAVSPDNKNMAREAIVQALSYNDYALREKIVRTNHVASDWGVADLKALATLAEMPKNVIDGILLPKVETIEQINQALAIYGKEIPVWVMIETPLGIINVEHIAAHKNVAVLVLGTNDLAKELRVGQSEKRAEFFYAFSRCIMAARAFHCDVLDGVYNQLDNEQGFMAVCEQGKMLGFDGKTLIHPKQLESANKLFCASEQEVKDAEEIIHAWQECANKAVLVVKGRLVEELHVIAAQRLLAMQALIQKLV